MLTEFSLESLMLKLILETWDGVCVWMFHLACDRAQWQALANTQNEPLDSTESFEFLQ